MSDEADATGANIALVERFLAAFDRRWPTEDELDELLAADVRFVERPNLVNPAGSERNLRGMRAGIEAGRTLLASQRWPVDPGHAPQRVVRRPLPPRCGTDLGDRAERLL